MPETAVREWARDDRPEANAVIEDFERNRQAWDAQSDAYQREHGEQLAAHPQAWGPWSLPESELMLLGHVSGCDVLEYGCGAAQWSIALARRGARVTGLDNSGRQLDYARAAVLAAGVAVDLVHAPGESTPFAAGSFDVVFCDHGAMSFAAPEKTIPEVARIARSGAIFVFNVEHPLHAVTWDDSVAAPSTRLHRPYFTLDRYDDPQDGGVSFIRSISTYVALLDQHGFDLERLLEPRAPAGASTSYAAFAPPAWARDFPAELIVRARRRSG